MACDFYGILPPQNVGVPAIRKTHNGPQNFLAICRASAYTKPNRSHHASAGASACVTTVALFLPSARRTS